MTITEAMVLAAGLGTRMRPITETIPKPLVKIGGKPLIDYALDILANAGVRRAAVNVHYLAEQMVDHLARYNRLDVVISDEREKLLNSGGGLVKGLRHLSPGPIFVMNADLFWLTEPTTRDTNLTRLAQAFDPERMDMILLCARPGQTTGHGEKHDFNLSHDGRLVRHREGDPDPVIYAGAIVLNTTLFDDAPAGPFNLNIYFDRAIAGGRLFGLPLEGHWLTVGTPEAIGPAEEIVRRYSAS